MKRDTIQVYDVVFPESILDLALRHTEQIALLERIQDALLSQQTL